MPQTSRKRPRPPPSQFASAVAGWPADRPRPMACGQSKLGDSLTIHTLVTARLIADVDASPLAGADMVVRTWVVTPPERP